MTHEFIAWNKNKQEWADPDDVLIDGHGDIYDKTCTFGCMSDHFENAKNITIYPYINRKDKDGGKVYVGSLYKNGNATYEVYFDIRRLQYMGRGISDSIDTNMLIHTGHYKITGHIAEDGND